MHNLPLDRKRYLLQQNRQMKSSPSKLNNTVRNNSSQSYSPARASTILPNLVPQLTGEGSLMRRFSVWGGGNEEPALSTPKSPLVSSMVDSDERDLSKDSATPLQAQSTGGLWSSWWSSSGGEFSSSSKLKETSKDIKSAAWYIEGIRSRKPTDPKLLKHLISLRVHLSTVKLSWAEGFLNERGGMECLGTLLSLLVAKGGKRKTLSDTEDSVLYEVIKCLRVLLNIGVCKRHFFMAAREAHHSSIAWISEVLILANVDHTCRIYTAHRLSKGPLIDCRAFGSHLRFIH